MKQIIIRPVIHTILFTVLLLLCVVCILESNNPGLSVDQVVSKLSCYWEKRKPKFLQHRFVRT